MDLAAYGCKCHYGHDSIWTYILHLHGGLFIEVTRLPVPDTCIDLDSTYPPRHGTLTNCDPTDMERAPKDLDGPPRSSAKVFKARLMQNTGSDR